MIGITFRFANIEVKPKNIMSNPTAGLYIHIPFCLSKCAYCSFCSIESVRLIPQYIKALARELEFYRRYFGEFATVYLGGGTPSLLKPGEIDLIFQAIRKNYIIKADAEITLEANAGDISAEYLKELRAIGINRLNVGIQSFNDKVLKILGRRHDARQAVSAITAAKQAGFKNLGIDLIYGVYGQSIKLWEDTIKQALAFMPEHISCYQLSLNEKTPLGRKYQSEGWRIPAENLAIEYFNVTADRLEGEGYLHYEVSNFARREKFISRHNTRYWRHEPYLGLGASAHSYLSGRRWWNKNVVARYIKDIAVDKNPVAASEQLTDDQLRLEELFLGLRTKRGINIKYYKRLYGVDLISDKKAVIEALIKNKLVIKQGGFLRPTRAGMAVADSLALI